MSDPASGTDSAKSGLDPVSSYSCRWGTRTTPCTGRSISTTARGCRCRAAQCIRADEELAGGIIHKPMFERLVLCGYAVADLSMANANVYYELGDAARRAAVEHRAAARPTGCALPFDVGPLRGLPYHRRRRPGRTSITWSPDRAALADGCARRGHRTIDSPLFHRLADLAPTGRRTGWAPSSSVTQVAGRSRSLKKRLIAAAGGRCPRPRAPCTPFGPSWATSTTPQAGVSCSTCYGLTCRRRPGPTLSRSLRRCPAVLRVADQVREQLGVRPQPCIGTERCTTAEEILRDLLAERGPDSETYGLLGRVLQGPAGQSARRRTTRPWPRSAGQGDRGVPAPDSRPTGATTTPASTRCS